MTSLAPLCLAPRSCIRPLDRCRSLLTTPPAEAHQIVAFLETFRINDGACERIKTPAFIRRSGGLCEIVEMQDMDCPELRAYASQISSSTLTNSLQQAMINVASKEATLIAFPGIIVMQAHDLCRELKAIAAFTPNLSTSDWARAALATVVLTPPGSMHSTLQMVASVNQALGVLRDIRSQAFSDAKALGISLADATFNDVRTARETIG